LALASEPPYDSLRRRREQRPSSKRVASVPVSNADVHAWREEQRQQYLAANPPDRAMGFGYKTEWLAVRHDDARAVIAALGLEGTRSASWPEGTWAINDGGIFVTPPMHGFVFVVRLAILDALDAGWIPSERGQDFGRRVPGLGFP
jgi:hypothetical protein